MFRTLALLAALVSAPLAAQTGAQVSSQNSDQTTRLALTFDDLPAHGPLPPGVMRTAVITDILAVLKASGTPPVFGFVNGVRDQENPADEHVLDLWRAAGYPLGNHTWSHMNLNDHTAAEWEADTLRNEPLLQSKMGANDWLWLRFPFLAEGHTPDKIAEVRTFLAQHGYRIAGVTASFGDYLWNDPYAHCLAKHDTAAVAQLESSYLIAARQDLQQRRAIAQAGLGYPIPLVLLMHVGAFDAHMLPRLLTQYRQDGVVFISLQSAESDPFYANDLNPNLPQQPDTLESLAAAMPRARPIVPPADLCR